MMKKASKATSKPAKHAGRPVGTTRRLRCMDCTAILAPHVKLRKGAATPTGHFGRWGDDIFCGMACAYRYAVAQAKRTLKLQSRILSSGKAKAGRAKA